MVLAPAAARAKVNIANVMKGKEGERDILTTASGVKMSELSKGQGGPVKPGDIVMIDVVGTLEDGTVFLDTHENGVPLAFEIGTTNKYIPEGLSQAVETMDAGSLRLAVVPPSLGYAARDVTLTQGRVPPNSRLYYEIELLRCQKFTIGLACCPDAKFPCIKLGEQALTGAAAAAPGAGAAAAAAAAP